MKIILVIFLLSEIFFEAYLIELDIDEDDDLRFISKNKNGISFSKNIDDNKNEYQQSEKYKQNSEQKIPFKLPKFLKISKKPIKSIIDDDLSNTLQDDRFSDVSSQEEAKTKNDSPEAKSLTSENSEKSESSHLVEGDSKIFSKTWDEYDDQKFKKITSDEHSSEKRLTNLNQLEHNYFLASNGTTPICQLCPRPFLASTSQRCKNTFGLFNTTRGEAQTALYYVVYGVKCVNGVTINSTLLNALADIQRQKIYEASLERPDLFNLISVQPFRTFKNNTFSLLFATYSNSLLLLELMYSQLLIVASVEVNVSSCQASYQLLTNYVDVNECHLRLDTCPRFQVCINSIGSFICACPVDQFLIESTCDCGSITPFNAPRVVSLSFGGTYFLYDKPSYTDYKVSTIIMIIILAILAIINLTAICWSR